MTHKHNGGPAFPLQSIGPEFDPGHSGMTMRDYFAAKSMQAILPTITEFPDELWRVDVAISAYKMADAMLAAREEI